MTELLIVALLLSVSWFSIWLLIAFSPTAAGCTMLSFCSLMLLITKDIDRR